MVEQTYQVLVLDMQPIDPPVGGGRLRLLGLYHNLGESFSTRYIGSYDWPGEKFRDHFLSKTLREIDIPLSTEHFIESRKCQERVGGKTIIDSTFHLLAKRSPQYVDYVRNEVRNVDAVIFSHPWVYPLVKDLIDRRTQTVIYDSHNVEGYLRCTLLDDGGVGTEIVREVVCVEAELCHFADIVLACSSEDIDLFHKFYNVPFGKMRIVPNGVFTEKMTPVSDAEKRQIKKQLGLESRTTSIFIGSNYVPNVEACNFIIEELAPNLPEMVFIIAGGVGDGCDKSLLSRVGNVKITGFLTEQEKYTYLAASDMALNPMFSGSGTNIKMFDYMAVGLPIITTKIGARGVTEVDTVGIMVRDKSRFTSSIQEAVSDYQKLRQRGKANRDFVSRNYSWEKLSPKLGGLLSTGIRKKDNCRNQYTTIPPLPIKFALMSSWNIRCGIAEYSRHLANSLEAKGLDLRIIANSNATGEVVNSYLLEDITKNVYPLWHYDYRTWRDTEIDRNGIFRLLRQEAITKLNIQYHPGFFNQEVLLDFIKQCIQAEIEVTITFHNSKDVYPETFAQMGKLKIKIVVHTLEDKRRLDNQGIHNVYYIPHGVLDFSDESVNDSREKLGIVGDPVIGSFGFLRQYKGVLELIEAVGILRNDYPDIRLLGLNSLYPSEDSFQYYQQCNKRIEELELHTNITLLTDFLPIEDAIKYLHTTDIIVLPYYDSKEGASGAGNIAIASRRPLLVSNSEIFAEIRNVTVQMKNITPQCVASEIQSLISNRSLLEQMKAKVSQYVDKNSYAQVANQYIQLIIGEDV